MSFLSTLRTLNLARQKEWDKGEQQNLLFRALEHVCESGELGNKIKKLWRQKNDIAGSQVNLDEIKDEVGDVIITLDLLCQELNIDIAEATIQKFNKTSEKMHFATTWDQPDLTDYEPHEARVILEQAELEERLLALNMFLNKGQPPFIDDVDWDLLNAQAFNMRGYNYILLARIRKFKDKKKLPPLDIRQGKM